MVLKSCFRLTFSHGIDLIKVGYWVSVFVTLFKLWLIAAQPLAALGLSIHDDRLFINLAANLASGNWLGEYNNLTLIKGPVYPIFIAVMFWLNIPLLFGQHVFYVFACIVCSKAIKPYIKYPWLVYVIYVFLVLNPITFTDGPATRVLREGIYPSLTLLVFALCLETVNRASDSLLRFSLVSVGLGLALSAFWLTREEGVWILPGVVIVYGVGLVKLYFSHQCRRITSFLVGLIPFIVLIASIFVISLINYRTYGVFTTVELKSEGFLNAYGSLSGVRHQQWEPDVPVPKEVRKRVYGVSKSFAELEPYLEGDIGNGWASFLQSDEIKGGWFVWALRDAVAAAGYHQSGDVAEEFYNKIGNEIRKAEEEGEIECTVVRRTMTPPWHREYFEPLIMTIWRVLNYIVYLKDFNVFPSASFGGEEDLRLFRNVTNEGITPTSGQLYISGWAFSSRGPVRIEIRSTDGKLINATIKYTESQDVYKYFKENLDKEYTSAKEARFEIWVDKPEAAKNLVAEIWAGHQVSEQVLIDKSPQYFEGKEVFFNIDVIERRNQWNSSLVEKRDYIKLKVLEKVGELYKILLPLSILVSFIFLFFQILMAIKEKKVPFVLVVLISLLITILARVFIIALITVSSFPAVNTAYLSAAYPLTLLFIALAVFGNYREHFSIKQLDK